MLLSNPECQRWFNKPVNPILDNCPSYPTLIERPMDFGLIRGRIFADHAYYTSPVRVLVSLAYREVVVSGCLYVDASLSREAARRSTTCIRIVPKLSIWTASAMPSWSERA